MQICCINVYNALLVSDKGNKSVKVVAPNMRHALRIVAQVLSNWEDSEAYEISSISLLEPVFIFV